MKVDGYSFFILYLLLKFYKCEQSSFIRCARYRATFSFPCFYGEYHSGSCDSCDNSDWKIIPCKFIRLYYVYSSDYKYIKHS